MRIVITRNLTKPLFAVALLLAATYFIAASRSSPAGTGCFFLILGAGGVVSAVLLQRGIVQPGTMWGSSASSTALSSLGFICFGVHGLAQDHGLEQLGSTINAVGFLCVLAGMLLGMYDRRARGGQPN